jgi:hypothetical protein
MSQHPATAYWTSLTDRSLGEMSERELQVLKMMLSSNVFELDDFLLSVSPQNRIGIIELEKKVEAVFDNWSRRIWEILTANSELSDESFLGRSYEMGAISCEIIRESRKWDRSQKDCFYRTKAVCANVAKTYSGMETLLNIMFTKKASIEIVVGLDEKTAKILCLHVKEEDCSVGEYMTKLLAVLLKEGEAFSGKRPFGNSGWQFDLERL